MLPNAYFEEVLIFVLFLLIRREQYLLFRREFGIHVDNYIDNPDREN